MQKNRNKLSQFGLVFILLTLLAVGYIERWSLYDFWRLRDYSAPMQVSVLADEISFSETGRRLFYVNKPSIDSKEAFRTHCTTREQTIVLGCFIPFNGIYLQDISDERLDGVMQVTTAHEMLHAAYQRLGAGEKNKVNSLLDDSFSKLDNPRIKDTIDDYKKTGADISNELHSILGTEVRNLPVELETHYKKYFTDRSKIVAFSEKYESAFTSRKQQAADYQNQITSLKQEIDASNADIKSKQSALEARQKELNQLAARNEIDRYNAAVPGFNSLVNSYNTLVGQVRNLIDRHNELVRLHNEVVLEENELVKAIDNRPATVPAQ